jgi:hypothetical protein
MNLEVPAGLSASSVREMLGELADLLDRLRALPPGESLQLEFPA